MEEEEKGGDDSQSNDYILPESFFVTQMNTKDSLLFPISIYLLFYYVYVALDIAWEGELLEM